MQWVHSGSLRRPAIFLPGSSVVGRRDGGQAEGRLSRIAAYVNAQRDATLRQREENDRRFAEDRARRGITRRGIAEAQQEPDRLATRQWVSRQWTGGHDPRVFTCLTCFNLAVQMTEARDGGPRPWYWSPAADGSLRAAPSHGAR